MKSNVEVTELIRFHEPFDRSVIIKLRMSSYQIQVGKKRPGEENQQRRERGVRSLPWTWRLEMNHGVFKRGHISFFNLSQESSQGRMFLGFDHSQDNVV